MKCQEISLATTFRKVVRNFDRLEPESMGIGPRSEGGFGIDVQLEVSLPGLPRDEAEKLVEKAHQVCPYSNAIRNNVRVQTTVV